MESADFELLKSLAEEADKTAEELRAEIRGVNHRMCIFRDEALAELRACRRAAEICEALLVVAAGAVVVFLLHRHGIARTWDEFVDTLGWIFSLLVAAWPWMIVAAVVAAVIGIAVWAANIVNSWLDRAVESLRAARLSRKQRKNPKDQFAAPAGDAGNG